MRVLNSQNSSLFENFCCQEKERTATVLQMTNMNNNKIGGHRGYESTTLVKTYFDEAKKFFLTQPSGPSATSAPFSFILFWLFKSIVFVYDVITFPIYYFIYHSSVTIDDKLKQHATLTDPDDPYSSYVRLNQEHFEKSLTPPLKQAKTIPDIQKLMLKYYPKDSPILGQRRITNVITKEVKGKKMFKFELTDYEWINIGQVDQRINYLANAFLANGIKFQKRVIIFAETRMEWFLCAHALLRIGAVPATLYATLGLQAICHGINETEAEHVITTGDLLPHIHKIINKINQVKTIIVIQVHPGLLMGKKPLTEEDFNSEATKAKPDREPIKLITYDDLLEQGNKLESNLDFINNNLNYTRPSPDDLAIILYTSGSSGNPKGVQLTHRNLLFSFQSLHSALIVDVFSCVQQTYYAVLPLAHSYEICVEMTLFANAFRIGYGHIATMTTNSTAIMEGQLGDLQLLRPTIVATVPIMLNRIRKAITDRFDRKNFPFSKHFLQYVIWYKGYWLEHNWDTPLMNRIIFQRFKKILGGNARYLLSGGAPLSPDTHRIMQALLNTPIVVGYGLTETNGASALVLSNERTIGRVGAPLPTFKFRLVDWPEGGYRATDKPHPRGELVIGGPAISIGYFKLPDKTEEAFKKIEKDGLNWWLHTGDIVEVDENGLFAIIDRKKDLIKLQQGEYVSLGKIESELKNFKYVENICVYGDSLHTYIVALICPARNELKNLCRQLNKAELTFEQSCRDVEVINTITKELRTFCQSLGFHKMEIPQQIILWEEEWSTANHFLTPTMKINRRAVVEYYHDSIDEMYAVDL